MRVVVTGACGFVGRYLCDTLARSGHEVLAGVYSARSSSAAPAQGNGVAEQVREVQLDITDANACAKLIRDLQPEAIIHLAALTFVPDAEKSLESTLRVNVVGVDNVLGPFSSLPSAQVFVHVSSANVYGVVEESQLPLAETAELRPVNNYSLSKIMAEAVVQKYRNVYPKKRYVIFRPFNHIGPGQSEAFVCSSFAKQLAEISLGQRPPKINVGNLEARRDFTDVRDIVRAYAAALDRGTGVYNLASGSSSSIESMLESLIAISGLKVEVERDSDRMRPADLPDLIGDSRRAERDLGWKPTIDVRTSLEALYTSWVEQVKARAC